MTPANRTRLLVGLLIASASINALGAAFVAARVARGGGLRMVLERLDLRDVPPLHSPSHEETAAGFRSLPRTPGAIVFAGDSLIANGPWSELFSPIKNRGIVGERTADLLARIDEVIAARPSKVFLLIGTNDLAAEVPIAQTVRNLRAILGRIKAASPSTRAYLIGVLPVNQAVPGGPGQDNGTIRALNERLRSLAGDFAGVEYVDLSPSLLDGDGNLRREFTRDGVHLTQAAYLAIGEVLKDKVLDDAPARAE
jgi:hexosaminidase